YRDAPTSVWGKFLPEDEEFTELLAHLMVMLVEKLADRYLIKTYENRREVLQTVRGRPNWGANFGRHYATAIVCDYKKITADNVTNRLFLCGLEAAKRLLKNPPKSLESLLFTFRSVTSTSIPTYQAFLHANRKINRLSEPYRPALLTARSLLFGFSAEDIL